MNTLFQIAFLVIFSGLLPAAAETIKVGDLIFLKAQIKNCNEKAKLIDYVQVPDTGAVVFFKRIAWFDDFTLEVTGLTTTQVADHLADELEKQAGFRPKTLEVTIPAAREVIAAKSQLIDATKHRLWFPCKDPGFRWGPEYRDLPPLRPFRLVQISNPATTIVRRMTGGAGRVPDAMS